MADPYSILGVSKGADEKDIKSAYRKLAKELHPDRNKDNPKASERFAQATQAYDLLSDKHKRARFDRGEIDMDGNPTSPFGFGGGAGPGGRPGGGRQQDYSSFAFNQEGVDFADIFDGLFGGGGRQRGSAGGGFGGFGFNDNAASRRAQHGANVAYKLPISFEDAALLKPQRLTLHGPGQEGKSIELKLPAGVDTGTQMRLAGKGQPGPGGAGDAIVTIEVKPHRFFRRDGDDIRLELPITLAEAVKGGKLRVPTIEGPVMMTIRPGSNSGLQLRLKGRGFHGKGGKRGDQIVELQIHLPENDAALAQFVDNWSNPGDPRRHLG